MQALTQHNYTHLPSPASALSVFEQVSLGADGGLEVVIPVRAGASADAVLAEVVAALSPPPGSPASTSMRVRACACVGAEGTGRMVSSVLTRHVDSLLTRRAHRYPVGCVGCGPACIRGMIGRPGGREPSLQLMLL
jgi:hypothetical protein